MRRSLGCLALLAALAAAAWVLWRGTARDTDLRRGVERLKSLPYLSWAAGGADASGGGVLSHAADAAWDGVNLYASEVASGAQAVDMGGRVVHRWTDRRREPTIWKLIKPQADGTFGALAGGGTILRLDARSRQLARFDSTFHHDFDFLPDGRLVAPAFRTRRIPAISRLYPIRDDFLEVHDPDRGLVDEVSMGELIATDPELLRRARAYPRRLLDWRLDVLHTNTVTVLDREVAVAGGAPWPAGAVLVCWRNLDSVAVVDLARRRILWHWGLDQLDRPHQPTLVAGGRLLIFDNGMRRGWSRVVEVEPSTGEIVWEYRGDPPASFYSQSRGSAQRLANGNTLIVESQRGRAFEVTAEGEVVWEYLEPRVRTPWVGDAERATIYRMQRLGWDEWARLAGGAGEADRPAYGPTARD